MSGKKLRAKQNQKSPSASSASNPGATSPQAAAKKSRSLNRTLGWIVAAFALLLYVQSVKYDYTLDDAAVVMNNTIVKQGLKGIPTLLTTSYWQGVNIWYVQSYRPLSLIMFAVEAQFFPSNPHANHVVNVLLYGLTGLVLFHTLALMFRKRNVVIPFIASLLFMAHPVHTEVVSSIKSRDEILAFLLTIAASWFLIKAAESRRVLNGALACACFFLALLSKESAITFLALGPLVIYFFTESKFKHIAYSTLGLAGTAGIYMAIRAAVLQRIAGMASDYINKIDNVLVAAPISERLATDFMILGKYFLLLIFPHPLVSDYSFNTIPLVGWADIGALVSLAITIALVWYAFTHIKQKDTYSFAILFYAGTILLIANILFVTQCAMAERFLYMPSLGFSMACAMLLATWLKVGDKVQFSGLKQLFSRNSKLFIITALILVAYGAKTMTRNEDWKNNLELFTKDVETAPTSARLHFNVGAEMIMFHLDNEKDGMKRNEVLKTVIDELTQAITIYPDYFGAYFYLGKAYGRLGQYDKAFSYLDKSIAAKQSDLFSAYNQKAYFYLINKQFDKTLALCDSSIQVKPDNAEAYNYRGAAYSGKLQYDKALEAFTTSLKYDAKDVDVWSNLGAAYGSMKDFPNAITAFKKALDIDPSNSDVRKYLAMTNKFWEDSLKAKR